MTNHNEKKLSEKTTSHLVKLLGFIVGGDYSVEAKRHAKGLLLSLVSSRD